MVTKMIAENTINGSFGSLKLNGELLANVRSIEYTVELEREELMIAGERNKQFKAKGVMGTGNFVIYKVTSLFVEQMVRAFAPPSQQNHALAYRGDDAGAALDMGYWLGNNNLGQLGEQGNSGYQLEVALDDPEQFNGESEVVILERVKLWSITGGFNVDDLVEQTIEYTFEGFSSTDDVINAPGSGSGGGTTGA